MTREQAINYLFSRGFTNEQVGEVVRALTYEPTTKNDLGVDCISRTDAIQAMQDKAKKLTNEDIINGLCGAVAILYEMPSVTPQLSVSEVTALAEWTEKLTKASEDAYNKGFADGANEVLDKLRAEIEKLRPNLRPEQMTDYDYAMVNVVNDIVAIIDKYKAETEETDGTNKQA